ncbi:sensor histidine kinase [Lutibacter maritimus]|uniref:histidine kinase n=1 Tax=Lutibacter maritimus TaxID=593133 RepID=A0A1I6PJV1_9FLAO|nr:sensor histidine kinase [Lutibacter maritimus]SFS40467.1 Histidine kinase [Lutibacter maritimus]
MKLKLLTISLILSINLFGQTSTNSIVTTLNQSLTEDEKIDKLYSSLENNHFLKDTIFEKTLTKYLVKAQKNLNFNYALRFTNELANYYIYNSLQHKKADSILTIYNKNIDKCTHIKDIGKFYIAYSEASIYMQNHKKSIAILKNAITFFEKEKDSSLYEFAYSYLKAGEATMALTEISESAGYFKKAEELFTYQKDTLHILWTKNGLSTLFSINGLFDEAEQERELIYEIGSKIGEYQVVAMAHISAVLDARFLEKPDKELYHIRKALINNNKNSVIQEIVRILTLSFATSTYARNKKIDSSNYYLDKLKLSMKGQYKNPFLNSYYKSALAQNAFAKGNYTLAEKNALDVLNNISKENNWISRSLAINSLLAEIYEKQSNLKKSLFYLKNYIKLKDSLIQLNTRKKFDYVQTQFETDKKDSQIVHQQKNIALLNAENKLKNQWILFGGLGLVSLFGFGLVLRSKYYAKKKQKLQESFTQEILKTQELERTRIASELHDNVSQKLLLIKNALVINKIKVKNELDLVGETIKEVREMSHNLHPFQFEKLGLVTSLKNLIKNFQKNSTVFYSEDIQITDGLIPKENEIYIFRMLQECLTNVEKHAKATACNLSAKEEKNYIIFKVKDNGKGFDTNKKPESINSLGMKTLHERAHFINAKLQLNSTLNKGTSITIKTSKI